MADDGSSDHDSAVSSDHDDDSSEMEFQLSIGKRETKVVSAFRVLLVVVLVVVATAVSLTAYFLTRESEQSDFETAFESHANKVVDSFDAEGGKKTSAIISLSVQLTSYAEHANESWPFVTLPDFEIKASLVMDLAEVFAVMVFPLVTNENLREWGQYSVANQGWYAEGVAIQQELYPEDSLTQEYNLTDHTVPPTIMRRYGRDFGPVNATDEPFFPVWTYSPPIPLSIVNFDWQTTSLARNEFEFYRETGSRQNIIGRAKDFAISTQSASFATPFIERSKSRGMVYESGPLSFFYTPIFERIGDPNAPMVGLMGAFIYWQAYFESLLPDTARGIIVILENDCNQTYSYEISGKHAQYLGEGDLHDPAYDDLEVSGKSGIIQNANSDEVSGGCNYQIRVYPSKDMQDDYLTKQPLIIALSLVGVFLFTALVFIGYDRFVERRQKLVMETAVQSTGVVNQLFPDEVRDRLYEKEKSKKKTQGAGGRGFTAATAGALGFVNPLGEAPPESAPIDSAINPIADEYKNCTVLFADLAGFTEWSSTRTPTDVFFLLETLYGAFDKLARKLGVFKVETIGDCYVAVTGLPKPQDGHAVIMTKFASRAMNKMNDLIHSDELISRLGQDTSQLALRVGLNSGPVTAGVLRGEKARFQLFGDTVNTAARMESNGQKGRIHVSQATADLLAASGRSAWLSTRKELVDAKGKGKMQCYWVDINYAGTTGSTMMSTASEMSSVYSSTPRSGTAETVEDVQQQPQNEHGLVADCDQQQSRTDKHHDPPVKVPQYDEISL